MQAEIDMLVVKRPAGIGAHATAIFGTVVGCRSIRTGRGGCAAHGGSKHVFAGEHPIAEPAVHAEDFIVSEARLESQLGNHIRRRIECVTRGRTANG